MEMSFVWLEKWKIKRFHLCVHRNWRPFHTDPLNRARYSSLVPFRQCRNDRHLGRAVQLNFSIHHFLVAVIELDCLLLPVCLLSICGMNQLIRAFIFFQYFFFLNFSNLLNNFPIAYVCCFTCSNVSLVFGSA